MLLDQLSSMETTGLWFQPKLQPQCVGHDCDRGHSCATCQAQSGSERWWCCQSCGHSGGGGVSPYAAICRVILLFFHDSVKARLVILTSLWCWTVLVESLWTDKRAGSGSVSLIIWPFSISLGTCCCFKPDRAISRKGLWLVPDVWTAVGSQGNTAIYPEDIKWPNDHIIWRTNLSKSCLQAGEMSSNPFVQIMSSPMEKKNSYF